jgi:hypothetical protein
MIAAPRIAQLGVAGATTGIALAGRHPARAIGTTPHGDGCGRAMEAMMPRDGAHDAEREQRIQDMAEAYRRAIDAEVREFSRGFWQGLRWCLYIFIGICAMVLYLLFLSAS